LDLGLVVVAIAPIVFLAWFVYTRDRYEPEPRRLILKTFFVGAAMVVPVAFAEIIGSLILPVSDNLLAIFLHFLLVVGLVEESSKYVAVRVSAYRTRDFNESMDGLVYGAIAGLGFAAPENLVYVLSHGLTTGIIRAVLSVPGHALWGAIIGYYLARQKLGIGGSSSGLHGLSYAIVLHAVFDFSLVALDPIIGITIAVLDVAVGWVVFSRFTKAALAAEPLRHRLQPPAISQMTVKYCINCGSMLPVEDRFCRSCGTQQL